MSTSHRARAAAPAGLVLRPYAGEADVAAIVRISNAENEAGERVWLGTPSEQFDARRDIVVAELEGEVVAFAGQEWIDLREGDRRSYRVWGSVDPAHRRRGIGTALLADNERRARALAATHDVELRRAFGSFSADGRPGAAARGGWL